MIIISKPACWNDVIEPPMMELEIDGKQIFLNSFTQRILKALNFSVLDLLKLPKGTEDLDDIES
ncbi:MAG: hypothetical protein GF364_10625, partial [Candidatus Lokiarchaeota archaeon]|nr:hypothetical protein [Candidatus Lokiarchaeota archaeon]